MLAQMLNQFAWPVALAKIGWHTYIIFTAWCGIQAFVIYFWIPETKNRTVRIVSWLGPAPSTHFTQLFTEVYLTAIHL